MSTRATGSHTRILQGTHLAVLSDTLGTLCTMLKSPELIFASGARRDLLITREIDTCSLLMHALSWDDSTGIGLSSAL